MMPDREKVVNAIDICLGHGRCDDCGYRIKGGYSTMDCRKPMMRDALALMKEQEAVEPKTEPSAKGYWFTCGVCGWWLFEVRDTVHFDDSKRIHYCASCGKAVKWE